MHNLNFVSENIPVNLNLNLQIKETIHNFFRRPLVVKVFTFLPGFLFGKHKALATLINKCHSEFSKRQLNDMEVKVFGGDKLSTLQQLEKDQQKIQTPAKFITLFKFSKENSLDEARIMRSDLRDQSERIGILNLANRRQPGGVGLTPYGGSQEEYLVRRSNLAWGLDPRFQSETVHKQMAEIRKKEGFNGHFEHHIPYFGAVISKNVTFIDSDSPDKFDVISSAAPDMREGSDESIFIKKFGKYEKAAQHQILENKIKAVFDAAISENIENLVLGAYGCGCFKNDIEEVAKIFSDVLSLDAYKGRFHHITFAITDELKLKLFEKAFMHN